jgi:hypothetical protein
MKWEQLTELEHEAIEAERWSDLLCQQRQKEQLCAEIRNLLQSGSGAVTPSPAEPRAGFETLIAGLSKLELRNRDLLDSKLRSRRATLQQLGQTTHNLHGVRRAYGSSSALHWESYS